MKTFIKTIFNRPAYQLLIVLVLAGFFRMYAAESRSLWYDEAFTVLFSSKGPAAILAGTLGQSNGAAAEEHPPAHYLMLWAWMKIWGSNLWVIRLSSALLGIGIVYLSYLIGKQIGYDRTGLAAALVAALSPFQIHYAQEVRMYVLLALACVGATYCLLMGMHSVKARWWAGFAMCSALAQYTHNLAAFYLLPLALTPLILRNRPAIWRTFLAGLFALFLYLPWLIQLPSQFAKIQGTFWTTRPSAIQLITTLLSYVTNLPLPDTQLLVGLFLTLALVSLAAWQTIRAFQTHQPSRWIGAWFAYLAFSPMLLLFIVSQWQPVYVERALLPSGAAFLLWLAWVVTRSGMPRIIQGVLWIFYLLAAILGFTQHVGYQGFPYAPYQVIGETLQSALEPGEAVIHASKLTMLPMAYYAPDLPQTYLADPVGSGSDTLALETQQVLGLIAQPDVQTAIGDARVVYFVVFERELLEYSSLGIPHPALSWLDDQHDQQSIQKFDDLLVYTFLH